MTDKVVKQRVKRITHKQIKQNQHVTIDIKAAIYFYKILYFLLRDTI